MKINKLTLHNFKIYAGSNVLDLSSDKPVILIGGMNGRGKTTILEAILLALYGRRSFAFEENGLSFPKYLERSVNIMDGSLIARVDLEFDLYAENEPHTFCVTRQWSLNTKPSLKTIVSKNNQYDQLLSENWDLFIEEMLPSAISPFFFFDGEKIADLANSDDDVRLKDSIKSLLGVNVIEAAIVDMQQIIKNKMKSVKIDTHTKEIQRIELRLNELDASIKSIKDEYGLLETKRVQVESQLKHSENQFVVMGGNLATNRKDLLDKLAKLDENLGNVNSRIMDLVANDLPLLMTIPLLSSILNVADSEKEQRGILAAVEQLPALLRDYDKNKKFSLNVKDFIRHVKKKTKSIVPVYNLTDSGYMQLQLLLKTLPGRQCKDAANLLLERGEIITAKATIENYLAISVDENEAGSLYQNILALTSDLAGIKAQQKAIKATEIGYSSQYDEATRQHLKIIDKTVSAIEGRDDVKRLINYTRYSIDVLHEYKIQLQAKKTDQLAVTMNGCFRRIASKRNLIREIRIEPDTLRFHYYGASGREISHSSFSAGEKQLLVIAMLWSLAICSKKQLPVIVDTPLARLDNTHRKALVTNYFPKASTQTILLSTDAEIYGKFYKLLSPYIGKEYTLQYDENTGQTSIESGYFGGQVE